jgi:hypothetical protein
MVAGQKIALGRIHAGQVVTVHVANHRPSKMSVMSEVSTAADTAGPVELLLEHSEKILRLESELREARIVRALFVATAIGIPGELVGLYIATAVTWHKYNMKAIWWPAAIVSVVLVAFVVIAISVPERRSIPEVNLDLELARERRRMDAAKLNLGITTRQQIYKDAVPRDIEQYERDGRHYRRIHNFLQAVIIVGSLAASTLTGLVLYISDLRWIAVGVTFSVALAAGFSGYFKFRERSFYLQLTADSIEQELSAVELGIGRYRDKDAWAIAEFTEQVELLKQEQRKRQQQLEQPSGGKESVQ